MLKIDKGFFVWYADDVTKLHMDKKYFTLAFSPRIPIRIVAIAIAFLLFFTTTFVVLVNVVMSHDGMMTGCPFAANGSSMCLMGIIQHLEHWQILKQVTLTYDVGLLAIVFLSGLIIYITRSILSSNSPPEQYLRSFQGSDTEDMQFDPLVRLFAAGIIQPRLYA